MEPKGLVYTGSQNGVESKGLVYTGSQNGVESKGLVVCILVVRMEWSRRV